MTLQGDLSTLDLSDLLQNLELHQRTGLLTLENDSATKLYFREGRLALFSYEGRPSLIQVLLSAGLITEQQLERARRKRRHSRKSLGEVFVSMKLIDEEELKSLAGARLTADACELISSGTGAFTFLQVEVPRGVFDPEERAMGLSLSAGPLVMEAARRQDHWHRIRSNVPSDATHLMAQSNARAPDNTRDMEIATALIENLDGTRSVMEIMAAFPHQRFEAYEVLADLCESGIVRPVSPEDLAELAHGLGLVDPARAIKLVHHGLRVHSQNKDLLAVQAELAEQGNEFEAAVDGLKMLAHLQWEGGEVEAARQNLERAKALDPNDPALWERSLELAIDDGRVDDAIEDGRHLAELYRGPGLHRKACGVLERLCDLEPRAWEIRRELALSRADCGAVEDAVAGLEKFGRERLAAGEFEAARTALEEVLKLDPGHDKAATTLEEIASGAFERRRKQHKKLVSTALLTVLVSLFVVWCYFEGSARRAYVDAVEDVFFGHVIENGNFEVAADILATVGERYPWTTTAAFDVPHHVDALRARAGGDSDSEGSGEQN